MDRSTPLKIGLIGGVGAQQQSHGYAFPSALAVSSLVPWASNATIRI
jgi:hypothetical protein